MELRTALGVAAALFACELGTACATALPINVAKTSFTSRGRRIGVERFAADSSARHHLVLVLHGAGGTLLDGPEMRRVARSLAQAGDEAWMIHYFDRTGTFIARDATMQKNFDVWLETVHDGIAAAREIAHAPIGIYGYSLGAFLAIAAASDNPSVGAVVEQAGGVWNNQFKRIGGMPPVLMLHGEEDRRVPLEKYARPLFAHLRKRSGVVDRHFFPNEAHGFTAGAMVSVRSEASEFFERHLVRRAP